MRIVLALVLLAFTACASLGLAPATNATGTIGYAYSALASTLTTAAQLASTGAISKPVAVQVNTALMGVKLVLDTAQAGATSSAPVPVTVITAATATLATVAAYLTCEQQKGAVACQL